VAIYGPLLLVVRRNLPGFRRRYARRSEAAPASTSSISPTSATQYDAATVLTVNGSNFTGSSVISIDGVAQTTAYVNETQLTCTLPAGETPTAILAVSGGKSVTVDGSNAQTLTVTAWAPSDVSGLQGWWRADAADITIGTGVSQWNDKSGNARHWVQGTGSAQPTFTASDAAFNNRGSVTFDGSNDVLTCATTLTNFITATAYTAVVVARVNAISSNDANAALNDTFVADSAGFFGMALKSTGPVAVGFNYDGSSDSAPVTITTGSVRILSQRHAGGTLYMRNRLDAEASASSGNTQALGGSMLLGRNAFSEFYDGKLTEVLLFNVDVSSGNRDRLVRYAAARYAA
jgi:hypothetical protein